MAHPWPFLGSPDWQSRLRVVSGSHGGTVGWRLVARQVSPVALVHEGRFEVESRKSILFPGGRAECP